MLLLPLNATDAARWTHTGLRRRMLYGTWGSDLDGRIQHMVGSKRRKAWRNADKSANIHRSMATQRGVIYDREPIVTHAQVQSVAIISALLRGIGWWAQAQRLARDVVGLREMLVYVSVEEEGVRLIPVFPDEVTAEASPGAPDEPVAIKWRRERKTNKGVTTVVWDCWDARDGTFRIRNAQDEDVTHEYDVSFQPWTDAEGRFLLPFRIYHAARTGQLWDAFEEAELVEGTLNVGVNWSFWGHVVRQASWPQRYIYGCTIAGETVGGEGESPTVEVTVDPAVIANLVPLPDFTGNVQISQWANSTDPKALGESVAAYEYKVANSAGVGPSDWEKANGDPRSGYALALSRDAQREAARRLEPQFRDADEGLLKLIAIGWNRWFGESVLPVEGWGIVYTYLPETPAEQAARLDRIERKVKLGLLDRVGALIELKPHLDRAQAAAELKEMGLGPDEGAAKQALNGAQTQSVVAIVQAVAASTLPRDAGIALIQLAAGVDLDTATRVMGSAGSGFTLSAPTGAAAPDPQTTQTQERKAA